MSKIKMLFGPAGSGKSSLISAIANDGFTVCDLEMYPSFERLNVARSNNFQLYGAADLNPSIFNDPNVLWITLTLPQAMYEARRAERDERQPEKAKQDKQFVKDFTDAVRDVDHVYVDASRSIDDVVAAVESLL